MTVKEERTQDARAELRRMIIDRRWGRTSPSIELDYHDGSLVGGLIERSFGQAMGAHSSKQFYCDAMRVSCFTSKEAGVVTRMSFDKLEAI
jgi:hypothetical protein